jgi:hypothetical protein
VRNWWHGIRETEGDEAVARYNRLLLLFLMTSFEQRASSKCYPECIIDLFHAEFKRIRRRIKDSELSRFAVNNDLFQKDLGLCRQVLFPVGNSVYEEVGLPRNLLWKGGVWQLLRYSWYLLLVSRGNRPYYGGHVHLDADNFEYSEEQRNLVRLRVAAMMRANPHIKGFMGGGWLYDPALDDISPHLAFGRRLLCANRAWLFYSGLDRTGGALSTSKKRRQLYDEGKYLPRSYLIAWPRKAMLKWADNQKTQV